MAEARVVRRKSPRHCAHGAAGEPRMKERKVTAAFASVQATRGKLRLPGHRQGVDAADLRDVALRRRGSWRRRRDLLRPGLTAHATGAAAGAVASISGDELVAELEPTSGRR